MHHHGAAVQQDLGLDAVKLADLTAKAYENADKSWIEELDVDEDVAPPEDAVAEAPDVDVPSAAESAEPEAAGEPVGPASDWYSLGAVLFEALKSAAGR